MRIAVTSVVDLERVAHNRLHEFLEHLSEKHEITVFSIQDWWREKQVQSSLYSAGFEKLLGRIRIVPYTQRRVPPVAQELIGSQRARKLIDAAGGKFDVHLDYNTLMSGTAFGREFRKRGVPTVYDLADDLVAMVRASPQIPAPLRPIGAAFAHRALRKNLDNAALVTVINETLAKDAGVAPEKTRVLPNGVDTRLFSVEGESRRHELGLDGAFVLGYVGVLREWVDFDPVLDAMAKMQLRAHDGRPLRLLVVGEEGGTVKIAKRAEELGIREALVFTGTVPYHSVPSYVRAMDVGLIPFNPGKIGANSLPLKLFEYMAVGKPVVSTPLPGVMQCAQGRVVYASSADEHMLAIGRLPRAPENSTARRSWVEGEFSWSAISKQLELLLSAAAGDRHVEG